MAVGLYESAGDWVFAYNEMNKKILPTVKMNLKFLHNFFLENRACPF